MARSAREFAKLTFEISLGSWRHARGMARSAREFAKPCTAVAFLSVLTIAAVERQNASPYVCTDVTDAACGSPFRPQPGCTTDWSGDRYEPEVRSFVSSAG